MSLVSSAVRFSWEVAFVFLLKVYLFPPKIEVDFYGAGQKVLWDFSVTLSVKPERIFLADPMQFTEDK